MEQREIVILDVRIDNGDLTRKIADNNAAIGEMKKQLRALQETGRDAMERGLVASAAEATEAAAKLENQIRTLTSENKTYRNTIDESTKSNNAQVGSYEQLYRQWKLAETQLKTMDGTIEKNADGTYSLTQKYLQQSVAVKEAKDALLQFNKGVLDGRLNVGNYDNSIQGLEQKLADLKEIFRGMDVNAPNFKQTREAIQNTELELGKLSGKIDEFGNRQPKNQLNKSFRDATEAGDGLVGALTLINVLQGDGAKKSEAMETAEKGLAIVVGLVNVAKGARGLIETAELVRKKLLFQAVVQESEATIANTAVTEGATVAQEGLNVAMEANPVGILIVSLLALGAALEGINLWMTSSSEETKKLEEENKKLTTQVTEQNRVINDAIKIAEAQLGLDKSSGESAEALRKKEADLNKEKEKTLTNNIKLIESAIAVDKSKIQDVINNDSVYESLLRVGEATLRNLGFTEEADAQEKVIAANKADRAKDALDDLKKQQDALVDANAALLDNQATDLQQTNDLYKKELKAQQDHISNQLLVAQDGSRQKLTLQLALLKVQLENELAAEDQSGAQKAAIVEKYNELSLEANRQFAIAALKDQADQLQLQINTLKNGSQDKLDAQLRLLDLQMQQELSVTTLSETQIADIKEKYRQADLKAQQDYDDLFLTDYRATLDNQLKALENQQVQTSEIRKQELNIQLEDLDAQKDKELNNAQLNADEIAAIEEKYRVLKVKAEQDVNEKIYKDEVAATKDRLQALIILQQNAGDNATQARLANAAAERDAILNDQASTNEMRLLAESKYQQAVQVIEQENIAFVKKTYSDQQIVLGNFMAAATSMAELFGANQTTLNEFAKMSALFQIGLDTAKAISSIIAISAFTSLTPVDMAINITAGVATVLADMAQAKKIITGTVQPTAPTIQGFAVGGPVSGQLITSRDGVYSNLNPGDDRLVTVKVGEVVLNEQQQQRLGGAPALAAAGVPGFAGIGLQPLGNYGIQGFASGGLLLGNYTRAIDADVMSQQQTNLLQQLLDKPSYVTVEAINAVQGSEAIRMNRANVIP